MPQTLRVMAYNILYGGVTDGVDRTPLIAAQVNAVRPDVLALCEGWGFLDNGGGAAVHVVAAHLNPYSSLMRLQEAQVVVSRTRPGEPTVVMGDFNTLPLGHEAEVRSRRLLDESMQPDTRVCRYFAEAGFVDVLAARGVTSHTYPTPLEAKRDDFPGGVRLDYVMASRDLAASCTAAWVVDTPEAGQASDHLPVVAEFALAG